MTDLGDLMRRATDGVTGEDMTERAWAEGSRRRRQQHTALVAAAALVVTGGVGLGLAFGDRPAGDAPLTAAQVPTSTTTATGIGPADAITSQSRVSPQWPSETLAGFAPTTRKATDVSSPTYAVWSDPRLVSPAPAPQGQTWVILALEHQSGTVPTSVDGLAGSGWRQVPNGTYPWTGQFRDVAFEPGRIRSGGGCNDLTGAYSLTGDRLKAPALTPGRPCVAASMTSDALFEDLVADAVTVLGDDGQLYLAGFVSRDVVPTAWSSDNRIGPYTGPGPSTLPPWASKDTGPHTEPGPRDLG